MRRILLPALATVFVAATVEACGGAPPEPELHEGTRTLQQDITDAGADCSWHNERHDDYTLGTCGGLIALVVTDDDGILDDFEGDYRDDLEYGYFVRTDSALGVSGDVDASFTLSDALGERPEPI